MKKTDVTNPGIELRDMTADEWSKYVSCIVDSDDFYFQYGYEPSKKLLDYIVTMTPGVVYFSAYRKAENEMVGYVGITPNSSDIEFYVFPEFRKKGYGTAMVYLLIELWFAGRINAKSERNIRAETLRENPASIRLLEKLGFQKSEVGFRFSVWEDDSEDKNVIGIASYILEYDAFCDKAPKTAH